MSLTAVIGLALTGKPSSTKDDLEKLGEARAEVIKEYAGTDALAEITKAGAAITPDQLKIYNEAAAKLGGAATAAAKEAGKNEILETLNRAVPNTAVLNQDNVLKRIDALKIRADDLQTKLDAKLADLENVAEERERLAQELVAAKSQKQGGASVAELGAAKQELAQEKLRVEQLERNLLEAGNTHRAALLAHQQEIERLEAQIKVLEGKVGKKGAEEAQRIADADAERDKEAELDRRIGNVKQAVKDIEGRVSKANGKENEGDAIVNDAQQVGTDAENLADKTDDNVAALEDRVSKLQTRVEKFERDAAVAFVQNQQKAVKNLNELKNRVQTESQKPGAGDAVQLIADIDTMIAEAGKATAQRDLDAMKERFSALKTRVNAYRAPVQQGGDGALTVPDELFTSDLTTDLSTMYAYQNAYGLASLAAQMQSTTAPNLLEVLKNEESAYAAGAPKKKKDLLVPLLRDAAAIAVFKSVAEFNSQVDSAGAPASMKIDEPTLKKAVSILQTHNASVFEAQKLRTELLEKIKSVPAGQKPADRQAIVQAWPQNFQVFVARLPGIKSTNVGLITGLYSSKDAMDTWVAKWAKPLYKMADDVDSANLKKFEFYQKHAKDKHSSVAFVASYIGDAADAAGDYEPDLMGTDDARLVDLAAASDTAPAPQSSGPSWTLTGASRNAFDSFFGGQ